MTRRSLGDAACALAAKDVLLGTRQVDRRRLRLRDDALNDSAIQCALGVILLVAL